MMQVGKFILVVSLALLVGCAHKQTKENTDASKVDSNTVTFAQLAQENKVSINKLNVGMSKPAVVEAMGMKNATAFSGQVFNPFRTEAFQDKSGTQYEVLYYVTEDGRPFQPVKNTQLTPLILKNGALIGWGVISLRQAMGQTAEEVNITIDR